MRNYTLAEPIATLDVLDKTHENVQKYKDEGVEKGGRTPRKARGVRREVQGGMGRSTVTHGGLEKHMETHENLPGDVENIGRENTIIARLRDKQTMHIHYSCNRPMAARGVARSAFGRAHKQHPERST